jgi:hypothetical protein
MTEIDKAIKQEHATLKRMLRDAGLSWVDGESVLDTWADKGMSTAVGTMVALKSSYKQVFAPDNVVDQAIERLRVAATERAKTDGDQVIAGYIDKMAQSIGPSSGSAAGSLSDTEKAAKDARAGSFDSLMAGVSAHLQRTGGHDI